ncbi:RagB/SusD family nutrient uptake outer membrane protein [Mucilaginibacter sp. PAMB04168]|uniref:RagB/SusD family nutrient uptake outer membrane protein n=1 Tax=Mucilaginibacter sp. PAMB04168 TaxID=3138567 RepID=UPI0031F5FC4C
MKINKIVTYTLLLCTALSGNGCKKLLEEHPQSSVVPSFFNTPAGVLGGIAGAYQLLRAGTYGTEGFNTQLVAGTDDHLSGAGSSSRLNTYNGLVGDDASAGWSNFYQAINTLNGVLEYGTSIDLPDATRKSYLAQAKFMRAFCYFMLVQQYGDVPLHTTFITVPTQADTRAPVADVYAQIIKDLNEASADLPNTVTAPFLGKAATKSTALFLLGKVYLTRGWLNNTQSDFQQAYDICNGIITNKGTYGLDLWQDYADAFNPANDYGKETMFVSDHTIDPKYGTFNLGGAEASGPVNLQPWFYNFNYPTFSAVNTFKTAAGALSSSGSSGMVRDVPYGRPFIRTRPNTDRLTTGPNAGKRYILDQAFVNRTTDARYDGTFFKAWISNTPLTNAANAANNTRGITYSMVPGVDTAIYMPDFEVTGAPQFIGTRPFKGIVIPPSLWNANYFPSVRKFMDPSRAPANFNDPSSRPVVIYRFADVYMTAAEAAFKLNNLGNAAAMLNVIRQRAAFRKTNTATENAAAVTAMTITAANVTLDFILDERTREFYAETQRWLDLVRTKSLVRRVQAWNPEAAPYIKDFHVLRPIPQSTQIDRVVEGAKMPQNAGY